MNAITRRPPVAELSSPPADAMEREAFERLKLAGFTVGGGACCMTALGLTIDRSPLLQCLLGGLLDEKGVN